MRRLVAVGLCALFVGACTGGGGSSADNGKPHTGGTFRVGIQQPRSLDPAQATTPDEILLAAQLFSSLTSYDPTTLAVQPAIAASWTATPDQQHWDFTINPTATFSNGRAVTATDVKYSLERVSRRGSTASTSFLLEPVSGFAAFNDPKGTATELTGIKVTAPNVVHFDLDEPLSTLPALLGNPTFAIVPREAVEASPPAPDFNREPVTSGAFRLKSRTDDVLHLVPAAGTKAYVSAVDVHLYSDQPSAYAAFNRGALDWTTVPPDRVDEVAEKYGRAGFTPYATVGFYGFNLKSPKFADPRFREAIVAAIDRTAIVRGIYNGTVQETSRLVPDGIPGSQADPCGAKCVHDPDKARALIREAFPNGSPPSIFIDYDQDTTQEAIAKAMQANLKDVGITADLRPHAYTDYLNFALGGTQELFRLGWGGLTAYPTADAFLTPLFLTGSHENVTQFSDPQVDTLLRSGRAEADEAKRIAIDQQAERLILDQVPVVPIFEIETHAVAATRVKNLAVSVLGTFDATKLWLTSGPGVK
ncbi:MAG: ABC transporter substrate-binding protein [Acidimicrobiia bacterium]|nr:ABC transporter substrate-binding protein [Acidimicrobiia bacterium]